MYVMHGSEIQLVDDGYKFPIGDTVVNVMAWDMGAKLEGVYPDNTYATSKVGGPDFYPRINGMQCTPGSSGSGCAERTLSTGLSTIYPLEGTIDSPCTCSFVVRVVDTEPPVITQCPSEVIAVSAGLLTDGSMSFATTAASLSFPVPIMVKTESSPCPGGFCVYDNAGCEGTVQFSEASTATPVTPATRFYVGGDTNVTATYTDCANNSASCIFEVKVPGSWAKLATFEKPVCLCNCTGNEFTQTCSEGMATVGPLTTPNAFVSSLGEPLNVSKNAPQGVGYAAYWQNVSTSSGSSSNDNLGSYIGDTEDFDCDSVGVQPYMSSAVTPGLPLPDHASLGTQYFTMEDPDGMYWVELDTVAIAPSTTTKYVFAYFGGQCDTACTVFFKVDYTDSIGSIQTVYYNYTQAMLSTTMATLTQSIPAGTKLVKVSFGLESNDHTAEAYFDVVGVGEDGCMEPTNRDYNGNAVFQSSPALCDSSPCCNEPLAPGYFKGVQCNNHDITVCNFENTEVTLATMGTRIDAVQAKMSDIEATAQQLLDLIRS